MLTRLLTALALLLTPLSARADPVSAAAFFSAVGSWLAANWVAVALVALNVIESAGARSRKRAADARRRQEFNDNLQDRTATVLDAAPPLRVIYGKCVVGGYIAANFTSEHVGHHADGTLFNRPDGYRHLVIVFADHECASVNEIFINGKTLGVVNSSGYPTTGQWSGKKVYSHQSVLPASGFIDVPELVTSILSSFIHSGRGYTDSPVTVTNGATRINGTPGTTVNYTTTADGATVRAYTHLGVPNQAVDAYLNSIKPNEWDASHVLAGKCYSVLTLDLEDPEFQGGPPVITADINGRIIYDPRYQLNPPLTGILAGSPGTSPPAMGFSGNQDGLIRTIIGVGEEYGIPYVDIQWAGTPTATSQFQLAFSATHPAAVNGDVIYGDVYVKSNIWTGVTGSLTLDERNAAGTSIGQTSTPLNLLSLLLKSLQLADNRVSITRTLNQLATTSVSMSLRFNYTSGLPVTVNIRVGLPMLAKTRSVLAWTPNPALCLRDYLLAEWGYQSSLAEMNDPAVIIAANDCEVSTQFQFQDEQGNIVSTDFAGRYTCHGSFTTADGKEGILEDIKSSMAGFAIPSGQWFIAAGVWHPPVMTLTDDNIMGPIQLVQAGEPIAEIYNGLRGNYFPSPIYGSGIGYVLNGNHIAGATSIAVTGGSGTIPNGVGVMFRDDDVLYVVKTGINAPGTLILSYPGLSKALLANTPMTLIAQGGQTTADFQPYQNATYVAADGRPLWGSTSFAFTKEKRRCRNLSRIKVEQKRNGLVINVPAMMIAWPLQPNDRVILNSVEYGFASKTFRVTDWSWDASSAVMLTLQEDSASTWDTADAAVIDQTPNTVLPNPTRVPSANNVQAFSGTAYLTMLGDGTILPRVFVSWDVLTASYMEGGYVEVSWMGPRDNAPHVINASPSDLGAYIDGVVETDYLVIIVTVVNGLPARSAPVFVPHRVVGKSQPPPNVAGFTATVGPGVVHFAWTANTDLDYLKTTLHPGAVWVDTDAEIFGSKGDKFDWVTPAPGTYTVMAKHLDTSGNYSIATASVVITVAADRAAIKLNQDSFTNVNYSEAYIHGVDFLGLAIDAPGSIVVSGFTKTLPNGHLFSNLGPQKGWIVWDGNAVYTSGTFVMSGQVNQPYVFARKNGVQWEYDNNLAWTAFTPGANHVIIGTLESGGPDIQAPPGLTYGNILFNALPMSVADMADPAVWEQITNRPTSFRAVSVGGSSTTQPIGASLYNAETNVAVAGITRSYAVDVFRRSDGLQTSSTVYDVYGAAVNATSMAAALNALGSDKIVVVRTYDEPMNNRLLNGLDTAMYRCGASRAVFGSPNFHFRAAYILIGIPGCGEGNGSEQYQGGVDNDTNAWCDLSFQIKSGNIIGVSTSFTPKSLQDYSYVGDLNATYGANWGTNVVGAASVNASIQTAQQLANTADGNATNALTAANAATLVLNDITNDNVLSPAEKPAAVAQYTAIVNEQAGYDAQAVAVGVTAEKVTYDASVAALTAYLNTLSGWNTIPGVSVAVNGVTFRANFQAVYTARQALLNKISSVLGVQADFTAAVAWNFLGTVDGWTVGAQTIAVNAATVTLTSTSNDPVFYSPSIAVSGVAFTKVRARVRRLAGSGWDGICFFFNSNHNMSGGFYKQIPDSTIGGAWIILEWDMAALTAGGTDWLTGGTINQIRLDFGGTASDVFEVDWVAIGTTAPSTYGATWGVNVIGSSGVDSAISAASQNASNAAQAAQIAGNNATTALNQLTDIANDNLLTRGEKSVVILDWNNIANEHADIDARASAMGIANTGSTTRKQWNDSYSALSVYLGGLSPGWSDTTQDTNITPASTWRANWQNYYVTRQNLLNEIAAIAATTANWAGVSGVSVTTGQLAAGSATDSFHNPVAGPVGVGITSANTAGTVITTQAYGNYAFDCKIIITATFTATVTPTSTFSFSLGAWILSGIGTGSSPHYGSPRVPGGSSITDNSMSITYQFDYAANSGAVTAELRANGAHPAGTFPAPSGSIKDISFLVQVIKR